MSTKSVADSGLFTPDQWRQLAEWMGLADLDLLEVESSGALVRLHRTHGGYERSALQPENNRVDLRKTTAASAPCAGIFLDKHPSERQRVHLPGQAVRAGDRLGYVQVGVLLVPVTAPVTGSLGKSHVPAGTLVGYGTRLIDIEKEACDGN